MNRFTKRLTGILALLCAAVMTAVGYFGETLPDSYYVSGDGCPELGGLFSMTPASADGAVAAASSETAVQERGTVSLFGLIPIKDAEIKRTEAPLLIPGGSPIGIKLLTDGVIVVSTQKTAGGGNPAEKAGIKAGDCILEANGEALSSSGRLAEIIMGSHGEKISLRIRRDGKIFETEVTPEFSEAEGTFKAGLWIKDSSAGVGTLTYIDPKTGGFGALGHPISDADTQKILPLGSGEIVDVTITGCEMGSAGCPGELCGTFLSGLAAGNISRNCEQGIFGTLNYVSRRAEALPIAFKTEVKTGPATILTTVDGSTPKEYDAVIEKLSLSDAASTKNIIVRITDPELLSLTGGIVQGMSGSPILQDGRIVGAVTHVFVSDPAMGYGIFIENMLRAGGSLK